MTTGRQVADAAVRRFMSITDRTITLGDRPGRASVREIIRLFIGADRNVTHRLEAAMDAFGGPDSTLTSASMAVLRSQIMAVLQPTKDRLGIIISALAMGAARASIARISRLFGGLELAFTGRRLRSEIAHHVLLDRMSPRLSVRHARGVDGFGESVMRRVDRELVDGLERGMTQRQVVSRLRSGRGSVKTNAIQVHPGANVRVGSVAVSDGVFLRGRAQAISVTRTEVAEAQNSVSLEIAMELQDQYSDARKKILATFDERTAFDSIAVHGQVRPIDGLFMDGAGRRYLRPPARPNDREIVIPWRASWPDVGATSRLSQSEQRRIVAKNEAALARARRRARKS